ncbi:MAG: efflux RND transporter periplasmic adaptor subunit [Pseudomonadota bacterium]
MNYESAISRQSTDFGYADDQEQQQRKSRRRLMIIAAVVAVLAVIAAVYFFKSSDKTAAGVAGKDDSKQAARVTVVVPGRVQVTDTISATGTLAARRDMPVGVAGEGGLVTRVWVQPGDWVRQGQILVSIDRAVQDQQANQLSAQVAVAQADARLAQAELDRANALLSRGFISKADIERRTATRDSARARVAVAVAQLNEGRNRNGRLDVRAPASGLILARTVEPGQIVSAGSPALFRLAGGGEMELKTEMGEAGLARMRVGLGASVTPVGTASQFTGQIWQVSPIIDPTTRQGIARIALSYNAALRPGGFASAQINVGRVDAPVLPESAVLSDDKGNYVFVIDAKSKVERRQVKTGSVSDTGIPVIEGLSGNEQVVLSAGAFLNPGETVVAQRAK